MITVFYFCKQIGILLLSIFAVCIIVSVIAVVLIAIISEILGRDKNDD